MLSGRWWGGYVIYRPLASSATVDMRMVYRANLLPLVSLGALVYTVR